MCEMISESCLVMVVIRQLRSFTSVPYYYESHSSPRAGLTRRPGPPSEMVDPAEFNGHPTADHGRYEVTRKSTASRSIIAITSHALGKNKQRERQDVMAMFRSLTARANYWRKFSSACPNSCDRLLHCIMSAFGTKRTSRA